MSQEDPSMTNSGGPRRAVGDQVPDVRAERYQQLREQATEYYQQGRDRAQEWERGLETRVQRKPLQAVLLAVGVGVLVGLMLGRRR